MHKLSYWSNYHPTDSTMYKLLKWGSNHSAIAIKGQLSFRSCYNETVTTHQSPFTSCYNKTVITQQSPFTNRYNKTVTALQSSYISLIIGQLLPSNRTFTSCYNKTVTVQQSPFTSCYETVTAQQSSYISCIMGQLLPGNPHKQVYILKWLPPKYYYASVLRQLMLQLYLLINLFLLLRTFIDCVDSLHHL